MIKILIMGLPGSGKTLFAEHLTEKLVSKGKSVDWFNADKVREFYNDWDFTHEGRIRQATRLRQLATSSECEYVVCDFVAPLPLSRIIFDPDLIIWMDTIEASVYVDTNKMFTPPAYPEYRVTNYDDSRNTVLTDVIKRLIP